MDYLLAKYTKQASADAPASHASGSNSTNSAYVRYGLGRSAELTPPAEVLSFLRHWQLRDVPLVKGRKMWMDGVSRTNAVIGNFKRKVSDRTNQLFASLRNFILMCKVLH